MPLGREYWFNKYKKRGAYWKHNGDPKQPHAEFTSGLHAGEGFNSRLLMGDDNILRIMASELVRLFFGSVGSAHYLGLVECVVGPQTGATRLAQFLSEELNRKFNIRGVSWASPKRVGDTEAMIIDDPEHVIVEGGMHLLCDDVITTAGSLKRTSNFVELYGEVLPFFFCIVNISGLTRIDGKPIISLINHHVPTFRPRECPLCPSGSKAIRPKDNWAELTRKNKNSFEENARKKITEGVSGF